jgi:hypothetical protein
MSRIRRESGEGKLGCILWLCVLAIGILIGYKAIPVKLSTSELYDFMVEQAKFGANNPPEAIKRTILDRARELELPVTDENLSVERIGNRIRMRTKFAIPLEFPGYVYIWNFDFEIDRPVFIV